MSGTQVDTTTSTCRVFIAISELSCCDNLEPSTRPSSSSSSSASSTVYTDGISEQGQHSKRRSDHQQEVSRTFTNIKQCSSVSIALWNFTKVAVKKVSKFETEQIESLVNLSHENIIRYYGAIKESFTNAIVMEYVPGGNLLDYLAKYNTRERRINQTVTRLHFGHFLSWARQCTQALKFLHERKIIHKNMKSSNFLLSSCIVPKESVLKLADCGLKKPVYLHAASYTVTTFRCGSYMPWRAPEVIKEPNFSSLKSDNFSLAIVIWELFTCERPWKELSDVEISEKVCDGGCLEIPADCPKPLNEMLKKCWKTERAYRPKIVDISICIKNIIPQKEPNSPDKVLRMDDLTQLAFHLNQPIHWKEFGTHHLHILENHIDEIKTWEPGQYITPMLHKWLMREGKKATVGRLVTLLKDFHKFGSSGYEFLCEL